MGRQTQWKRDKIEAVPAKCVPKTCTDFGQDAATCANGPNCVFLDKQVGEKLTFAQKCVTTADTRDPKKIFLYPSDIKNKCENSLHPKCGLTANGGPACCTSAIENPGKKAL